jgi:Flp pilus assembly protein TadD
VGLLRSRFSAKAKALSGQSGNEPPSLEAAARERLIAEASAEGSAANGPQVLARIDRALEGAPDDAGLLFARAAVLYRWGRIHEAHQACLHAETCGRRDAAAYTLLGWTCVGVGNPGDAEAAMRSAIAADDTSSRAHGNLAIILQMQGRLDEAAQSHERALALDPRNIQSLINLGTCKVEQEEFTAAEMCFRRAIAVDGSRARAWANLAVALAPQDRHVEGFEAFARAEELENKTGEDVENFVNFALHLREAGQLQAGLGLYEKHLPSSPSLAGHNDYAFGLLTAGRFLEGWRHYEFRWMQKPLLLLRPRSRQLRWSGQSLQGKTILLRIEQGFGDAIQFLRYAPSLQALGATVLLGKFSGLAHCFRGVDRVVDRSLPASECDYYIDIVSLPRIFGTELETIPAEVPYIEAPRELVERWSGRLGGEGVLKVGVVWAGNPEHKNDRYRSLRLAALAPLWAVAGVRFISLQKGAAAAEWEGLPAELDAVNLGPELTDFTDTAAVISRLDLVICVDTAVAHLAGALGKPVWLLVAQPADFRWLEGREDSPWYPTMQLFRQSKRGDWDEVIERVKLALARVCDGIPPVAVQHTKTVVAPLRPLSTLEELLAGHRPGLSAVAETRVGIVQYLPDEALVGASIAWYGEYLQPQLDLLARLIRPEATILEAGAGVGMHALFLGAAIGPSGHLFLYEPRPVVQRILRQNLGANKIGNVTVMRRALGRSEADTDAAAAPSDESVDELRLERLDWLKVDDTSGVAVLEGAADTLWRLRPGLFIAAADETMLDTLAELVKRFSYRCWRLETALFNPANFNRRDTDIFAGGKALALLALPEEIDTSVALDQCVEI